MAYSLKKFNRRKLWLTEILFSLKKNDRPIVRKRELIDLLEKSAIIVSLGVDLSIYDGILDDGRRDISIRFLIEADDYSSAIRRVQRLILPDTKLEERIVNFTVYKY